MNAMQLHLGEFIALLVVISCEYSLFSCPLVILIIDVMIASIAQFLVDSNSVPSLRLPQQCGKEAATRMTWP